MKKTGLSALVIFLIFLFVSASVNSDGVLKKLTVNTQEFSLRYKLDKNTSFTINSKSREEQTMDMSAMGQGEIETVNNTEIEYLFNVNSIDSEGKMDLGAEYKKYTKKSEGNTMVPDPDYSPLIGKKVSFILSKYGEASGFKGFDELPVINLGMQGNTNSDTFIESFKMLFGKLPESPKKIGDTWNNVAEMESKGRGLPLKTKTNSTYTLIEETDFEGIKCLKVGVKFTYTITGSGEQMGNQMAFNGEGKGEGFVLFDYNRGIFLSNETTTDMEMTVTVSGMQEMVIPFENQTKTNVTVKFN